MKKFMGILLLMLLLQACSSGIEGTYSANSQGLGGVGSYSFRFEKGGKVYVSIMGVESEATYEKDGDKIKILNANGGNMILTITDNETIQGPMGVALQKQ